APRPPGAGSTVAFRATADDRNRAASTVAAAELFVQVAPPTPAANGTGRPMTAVDGAFDATVENLSWQGGLASALGATCAWVHARDAAGNWGPYAFDCFLVILLGPDGVPPAAAAADSIRLTNGINDLKIGWLAAWDEGLYGGTTEYRVLRSNAPRGSYADITGPIAANGSIVYSIVDPGRGSDASDYFYRIETIDAAANAEMGTTLAVKSHLGVGTGLNLLGMPADLTDPTFLDFAAGRAWADAWTYDGCNVGFQWASARPVDASSFALQ